jgi:hypothetical protein
MNSSRRLLNFIRAALLLAIAAYVFVGETIAPRTRGSADTKTFLVFALVAVVTIAVMFVLRRKTISEAMASLRTSPEDARALARWRAGYIITYAMCEAVALYGFVLRMLGFFLPQVAPFYLAAILLMLFYGPRRPATEQPAATPSPSR